MREVPRGGGWRPTEAGFLTPNLVGIVGLRTDIRIVPALPLRHFSLYFGSSPHRAGAVSFRSKTHPRARRALSAANAGGGVIQPISGLFVGPTRDGEARGGRYTLAGTNDDMLARA